LLKGEGQRGGATRHPGPFSREVSQAREAERGGEGREERPGATEKRVSPPVGERSLKAWGGASERTGGEEDSVATLPTIVVDLMDTSFDEGGVSAAGGSKGKGQESQLSEGEESGQEEVPNPDPAVAALSNEQKEAASKERKRLNGVLYRSRRRHGEGLPRGGGTCGKTGRGVHAVERERKGGGGKVGRGVHQVPAREGRSGRRSESGHDLKRLGVREDRRHGKGGTSLGGGREIPHGVVGRRTRFLRGSSRGAVRCGM
jgi:hypothetical protein